VFFSPLSRAVETACIVFKPFLELQKMHAVRDIQSFGNEEWNIGLHPRALEGHRFMDENIDWSLVHIGWNLKNTGRYARTVDAVSTRVDGFRRSLLALKPLPHETTVEVVVVGHQSIFGLLCKGKYTASTDR
jgi:broad specificity phosphatase PhoE